MARELTTPVRCIERETGASLFKDRCVSDTVCSNGRKISESDADAPRQDNHMIDALRAGSIRSAVSAKAILPRRGWCGRLVPDAHGAKVGV